MSNSAKSTGTSRFVGWFLLLLGCAVVAFGWVVPSRFNSVPFGVLREAGSAGRQLGDLAKDRLLDGNLGAAELLAETAVDLGEAKASLVKSEVAREKESNPQIARWGAWNPFLDAALKDVPLDAYSNEPGLLGVLIAEPCRAPVAALLAGSRDPLVKDLLETGSYTTYRRLGPVSSASGRPLEVALLAIGLFAQGDHFSDPLKSEIRSLVWEAKATGAVGRLEDFYLDMLSLMRIYNWGQLERVLAKAHTVESLARFRYLLHRRADDQTSSYSMFLSASDPDEFLDYLAQYGDVGYESLRRALQAGIDGFRLALREQFPIEIGNIGEPVTAIEKLQNRIAPFSLRNPQLSLTIKYTAFFVGSFVALFGLSLFGRFYKEKVSASLAFTQRFFGATASVVVFAVLSEPYLSTVGAFEGYSFQFVMPVLAEVDGEMQIVETTPTTSMETATLLSISFFLLLQILVFLICLLKVREIERKELDSLVKLRLMENEENLFDSGLYVGIAGTCIALVMQVIGLVEANLLAAYSSNLFGILCVAIVKIRLVRPYKTKLIMAGQDRIASLVGAKVS